MTAIDVLAPLNLFLQQTEQLVALAKSGDWQAFELLLAEREAALPALSDSGLLIAVANAGLEEEMRSLITRIQDVNNCLGQLAENNKTILVSELRLAMQAEKAIDAYKK